ncbi:hypothetical protein CB1_000463040 [Camelus ferus]|nr:hypothetical protein CB1_000463040 [Camelus ferus]
MHGGLAAGTSGSHAAVCKTRRGYVQQAVNGSYQQALDFGRHMRLNFKKKKESREHAHRGSNAREVERYRKLEKIKTLLGIQLYTKKFKHQLHTQGKQETDLSLDEEWNKEHTPVKASLNQSVLL